jgi:tetratricopeptide (TPR) repeat protein
MRSLVLCGVLVGACGESEEARCLRLSAAGAHAEAAATCERAFRRGKRAEVGMAAARALYQLSRDDDVLRLAAELEAGPKAGSAQHLVGRVLLSRGDDERGRAALHRAFELHRAGGDRVGASADAAALTASYWDRGRYREALEAAQAGVAEAEASGDPAARGKALMTLGGLLQGMGDAPRAARAFREAEPLVTDDGGRARLALTQGLLEVEEGNLAIAREAFERALAGATAAGVPSLVAAAHINLADVALRRRRWDEAAAELAAVRGAAPPSPQLVLNEATLAMERDRPEDAARALAGGAKLGEGDPDWAWRFDYLRGRVAERLGRIEDAIAAYRRAIDTVERMRTELGADEHKASFLDERRRPFGALFALYAARGDAEAAFAAMERAQARTFVDAFVAAGVDRAPAAGDRAAGEPLSRVEALRALLPALAGSPAVAPRPVADVLAGVRDLDVLAYFEADDRVWCVLVREGKPRVIALTIGVASLREAVEAFLARPDDDAAAAALGSGLFPPELGPLPPGTLYVVPSPALLRVPFAPLIVRGARLGLRRPIAYAPSVGVLAVLRAGGDPAATGAVVLADGRGDLPAAAAEGARVARALGVEASVGAAATQARLRAAAGARVLHVATHSGVDFRGGWLALADGDVTAAEVLAWRLRPRLVVLASCASAVTPQRELWGSLASAFLAAGSRVVLASLWSVDDAVTAELIQEFYTRVGRSTPAAALAEAQSALARRHPPSAWGAFVVLGVDSSQNVTEGKP